MSERPDPRRRDLVKCEDMRLYAERACAFLAGRAFAEYAADDMLQAAVTRCVEVIGEAARLVSTPTRRRAGEIPWALIVGMRNVLAHDYAGVNQDKVYEVVTRHLPALIEHLKPLIRALEADVGWSDEEDHPGGA